MKKYISLLISFTFAVALSSMAHDSLSFESCLDKNIKEVRGVVFDENTDNALSHATISVKGKNVGTLSDSLGRFVLSSDVINRGDALTISYIGYYAVEVSLNDVSEGNEIRVGLSPSPIRLKELSTSYRRIKMVTKGKRHRWGLMKCYIDGATAGDCFGYEIHAAKDKRMILDKVGFYYCDGDSSLTGMKFRINVYDMSDVSGDVTDRFVNVLAKPVYFEFVRGESRSGQFEYRLTETVELPKDAMVEIEMLENLNENKLWFNSGLVGKSNWGKSAGDSCWVLTPFSTPFFIDCIEVKRESKPLSTKDLYSISSGADMIR